MLSLIVNGKAYDVDVPDEMPLLWVIRDVVGLTGTKFGCGIGSCGCCTVHIDGEPVRACSFPVAAAAGKHITTIEGLSADRSHPVQRAWIALQVPQCGYCQSGQIMAAAALLARNPTPDDAAIEGAMTNVCRCVTYDRIRAAIRHASGTSAGRPGSETSAT